MELNVDYLYRPKSFNMVNMHNEQLLSLGLEPTYIKVSPLYINLQKDILFLEATDNQFMHKECQLFRDVQSFLQIMRESTKHKNISPQTLLENYYRYKCYELAPYTDENELSGNDVRKWLNHNAGIFLTHKCSYDTIGAYNYKTLNLINILLKTKREIYEGLYNLFKQSIDYKKTVNDLLIFMRHYHPSFIGKPILDDSFMHLPDVNDYEYSGYSKMFLKATQDILVRLIGFDKIESQLYKTITTSKPNIYEEFFNEIITGWTIVQLQRVHFDASSQEFYFANNNEFINSGENREYEEEAKWILKNVPYDQREKYLKY